MGNSTRLDDLKLSIKVLDERFKSKTIASENSEIWTAKTKAVIDSIRNQLDYIQAMIDDNTVEWKPMIKNFERRFIHISKDGSAQQFSVDNNIKVPIIDDGINIELQKSK